MLSLCILLVIHFGDGHQRLQRLNRRFRQKRRAEVANRQKLMSPGSREEEEQVRGAIKGPDKAEVEVDDDQADKSRSLRFQWPATCKSVTPLEREEGMTGKGK